MRQSPPCCAPPPPVRAPENNLIILAACHPCARKFAQGAEVRLTNGYKEDAVHPSCASTITSRLFVLGARDVCLVGENPTCVVSVLEGLDGYGHATTAMYEVNSPPPRSADPLLHALVRYGDAHWDPAVSGDPKEAYDGPVLQQGLQTIRPRQLPRRGAGGRENQKHYTQAVSSAR